MKISSDRDLATSKFVELYGNAELLKARIDFKAFANSPEFRALRPETYDVYMKAKVDDDRVFRDVLTLLSFYDSLSICVISKSCSQDSTCRYFFKDVEGFIQDTRPILAELRRREDQPFDQLINQFAFDICREQHQTYCNLVRYAAPDCTALRPLY